MKVTRVALVWALVLVGSTALSAQKTLEEYWEEAGLSFQAAEGFLKPDDCYGSERVFLACVHALNTAFGFEGRALTTQDRLKAEPALGTLEESFGPVALVTPKPSQLERPAEIYKELRRERAEAHRFWQRLYQNRAVEKADLAALLDRVKRIPDFARRESYLSASVINTFLMVSLDPNTVILPTQLLLDDQAEGGNDFTGIGAQMKVVTRQGVKYIVVSAPLEGSPALEAGLRAHDVVTHVDGESVVGKDLQEVVKKIRGPRGTVIVLTVERNGTSLELSITRDVISQPNIVAKLVTSPTGRPYGYVKFASFMKPTGCQDLADAIRDLAGQGARGLIFDLRNNGGGYLNQAVCVANLFLDKGKAVVFTKRLPEGTFEPPLKTTEAPLTRLPLVTLVNSGSASASEIVAGALQDHFRSWLLGDRTFGKGSVQTQRALAGGALMMRQTTALFYLPYPPNGRMNQIEGVTPDFTVYQSPNPTEDEKVAYREEDEYMALPSIGKQWSQQRPQDVSRLGTCLAKGKAPARFQDLSANAAIPPDYQALSAEDLLDCVLAEPQPPSSQGFEIGNGRPRWVPQATWYNNAWSFLISF